MARFAALSALALLCSHGAAQGQKLRILYPRPGGTVLALAHVGAVFHYDGLLDRFSVTVDGRRVPESDVAFCRICAGEDHAVLVKGAPWMAADGQHTIVVEVQDPKDGPLRAETRYTVASGSAGLLGPQSGIVLPTAFGSAAPFFASGGSDGGQGWLAAGSRGALSAQGSLLAGGAAWSGFLSDRGEARSLAFGQLDGAWFAALGVRTRPSYFALTVGVGAKPLPREWLEADLSFAALLKRTHRDSDLLSVADLVRFKLEWAEGRRPAFGAVLRHPYGWEAGLYQVPGEGWRSQASFTLSPRSGR